MCSGRCAAKGEPNTRKQEWGEFEPDEEPADISPRMLGEPHQASDPSRLEIAAGPGEAATTMLKGLIKSWWQESKQAGLKPSTYKSYRSTFSNFIQFLKHDIAAKDVIAFKDCQLQTPSPKTGTAVLAKTVKDSDLSAQKRFSIGL